MCVCVHKTVYSRLTCASALGGHTRRKMVMHQKGEERGRVKNEHNTAAQHEIRDEVETLASQQKKMHAFKYIHEKSALHTHAHRGKTQTNQRTRDEGGGRSSSESRDHLDTY